MADKRPTRRERDLQRRVHDARQRRLVGDTPDERVLLRHVAREVAAELYLIRSHDLSELARAIAAGRMTEDEARERARELTITSE